MSIDDDRLDCWIVTGMPGAGKSTVARGLAASLPRSACIHGDDVHDLIISGRVEPDQGPKGEAELQIELTQRNICLLARSFGQAGFVPVVDWVIRNRRDLDVLREELSDLTARLIVLAPSSSARETRKPVAHRRWSHLQGDMYRDLMGVGLWIDSTALTIEETLTKIRSDGDETILARSAAGPA